MGLTEANFVSVRVHGTTYNVKDFSLHLSGKRMTSIQEIEGLNQLAHLKNLNFAGNQITKIEGLDQLVNLQHLHLDNNRITKIVRHSEVLACS